MSGFQRSMRVWMPNWTGRVDERFEQGFLRQEDLVDEVEIARALRDQAVDLGEQRFQFATAVFVAEVDLRAEAATIRTAARRLDLGARIGRLRFEAVMVVVMAGHPFGRPFQGREVARNGLRADRR